MSAVVKHPSTAAKESDSRFCGQCGRMCQPLINDNVGFGPCVDDAASPIECPTLQQAIVSSYTTARLMSKEPHPETQALVKRLGIPATMIDDWVAKADRAAAIKNEVRLGAYGEGPCAFLRQAADWIGQGDTDERLLALIDRLMTSLDPTQGRNATMGEISEWHARLATRASELLSDPGDWEMDP